MRHSDPGACHGLKIGLFSEKNMNLMNSWNMKWENPILANIKKYENNVTRKRQDPLKEHFRNSSNQPFFNLWQAPGWFSYFFILFSYFFDFFCICLCILSTFFYIIFILKKATIFFHIFRIIFFHIFSEKNLKPRIPILQGYVCLKSRWHKHQNVFSMGAHINHRTWFFCAIYSETAIHKL